MTGAAKFESEFLDGLAFAFRKRRKAFKHSGSGADLIKVYELVDGTRTERLEIELDHFRQALRLHAWPDRSIWLAAGEGTKKAQVWGWTTEGRVPGNLEPQRIIAALEQTYGMLYHVTKEQTAQLEAPWKAILARGPVAVR